MLQLRTNVKTILSAVLLLTLAFSVSADEVQWTGWLGPNRDGWVDYFQPPTEWPDQLTPGWQIEAGSGYATPLVSDGRVYQYARLGEEEVLWCVDLKSGDTIWKQTWPVPFKMGGGGQWHGKGPKGAPVLSDGRLFAMGISGTLTAWDAETGKQLWRRDHSSEYEKLSHPYWGACTSPIVNEGRVFVHFGNDNQGVLIAHDVTSGEEIWKLDRDAPSYSSPLLADFGDVRQLVEWNHRALVGVDCETGTQLWEYPFEHVGTNQNMPTPAIHDGLVLVGGENRGVRCVEPKREDDKWTVTEIWHQKKVALDMSTAVVNGEFLYGFSHLDSGRMFCAEIETGDIVWQGQRRIGENVTFLSIPGFVVALLDKGEMQIIKAAGEDSEVVTSYLVADSPTWAAPVLLNDGVLIKDRSKLTRWTFAK